ncbi:MAG TPA: DUF349 domain-containing protein, partial [Balneola sp.]|nr:DUF349 domain-containing protein [Balneola sp.]
MERKVAIMNLEQDKNTENEKTESLNDQEVTNEEAAETKTQETPDLDKENKVEEAVSAEEESNAEASSSEVESVEEQNSTEEESNESTSESENVSDSEVKEGEEASDSSESTEEVSPNQYYEKILNKIKEVLETKDWGLISNEFSNLSLHIGEGPEPDEESKKLLSEFEELRADFEERKKAHYEELNRKREENLKKKKELLKQFADIINEEKWTATKEVSQIKNNWDRITQIPRDEIDALNERFESFMKEFDSHKVDRLVKKLEKEEDNLTLKLLLLDKMDALNVRSDDPKADFKTLIKEYDDLHNQWKKIGRVPNEKNQMVWDRFNTAEDAFNSLRFKNDKEYREKVEKSLKKKKKLIAEAEALVDNENIAQAARKVNKLHNAWKKTG